MVLKLKQERLLRGWSQTKLGWFAGGVTQADISAIENCRRTAGKGQRQRIALAMGMREEHLFTPVDNNSREGDR
jgi:hypothetical protein